MAAGKHTKSFPVKRQWHSQWKISSRQIFPDVCVCMMHIYEKYWSERVDYSHTYTHTHTRRILDFPGSHPVPFWLSFFRVHFVSLCTPFVCCVCVCASHSRVIRTTDEDKSIRQRTWITFEQADVCIHKCLKQCGIRTEYNVLYLLYHMHMNGYCLFIAV